MKNGITLPEQCRLPGRRTPQFFTGFSQSNTTGLPKTYNRSILEDNKQSLTYIQFGDTTPKQWLQPCCSKIPELPAKARTRAMQCRKEAALNRTYINNSIGNDSNDDVPGLTMKYFGESGPVIGCFTAEKKPIGHYPYSHTTKPKRLCLTPNTNAITPRREEERIQRFNALLNLK